MFALVLLALGAQGIDAATRHRDALAETMTRSQVEAAEDKAASWLGGG